MEAIAAAPAEQVVVLPNNPNVVAVAEQAAAHSPKKVRVVPTAGIPEGFAALLAYDPEADVDTNADNMAAAAARVVAGEVAQASRDAMTDAGPVKGRRLARRVPGGDKSGRSRTGDRRGCRHSFARHPRNGGPTDHEIVTVIEGEDAHPPDTRRIVEWLSERRPGISTEVHHGGQPVYPYVFSIE